MPNRATVRKQIAAVARATRMYLDSERGPTRAALELARNLAAVLTLEPMHPEIVLGDMLTQRLRHGWIKCGDRSAVVKLGAAAWRRAGSPLAVAA
jgi:hypothetical protein